ncbi:MAG: hypothetical protein ABI574_13725 [Burkholderiales bacterium]
MNKVYACIDGLANTNAVIDWAASAALRLTAPLEAGRHLLASARERTAASGAPELDGRLRHGEFVDTKSLSSSCAGIHHA